MHRFKYIDPNRSSLVTTYNGFPVKNILPKSMNIHLEERPELVLNIPFYVQEVVGVFDFVSQHFS